MSQFVPSSSLARLVFTLCVLCVVSADYAPAKELVTVGGLSEHQVEELRALQTDVVVPHYVPEGFRVYYCWPNRDKQGPVTYMIGYKNQLGTSSFVFEAAQEALPDSDASPQLRAIETPFGGASLVAIEGDGTGRYRSRWLQCGSTYVRIVVGGVPKELDTKLELLPQVEAVKVLKSLKILSPDSADGAARQ